MAALTSALTNRLSIPLQQAFTSQTSVVLRRFFSSQKPNLNSYVGAPEYPIPGTKSYAESMERLQNPRVLEMLSRKSAENLNPSEMKMQEWMQAISNQNAQLLRELNRLTRKIEQLENRLGTS